MPKLKTHRGAAKRFKKSGTGKKRPGRKAALASETEVSKANRKTVKKMVPYL